MTKIMRYFIIIATLLLQSCFWVPNWYKPQGYTIFRQMPKGGSPGFDLGWMHGCESGLGTQFGGKMYMTFYTWKKDPDISSNNPDIEKIRKRYPVKLQKVNWNDPGDVKRNLDDYKVIFWSAHIFCRHAAIGLLQTAGGFEPSTGFTPPVAGEVRYDPRNHSIGNVWKLHGKGDTRIGTGFW